MEISEFVSQLHKKGFTAEINVETFHPVPYDGSISIKKDEKEFTSFSLGHDEKFEQLFIRVLETL